ncbi:MAG: hypothetical protein IPM29_16170 [Planctomycetes bacterium]|nr:hypothetical protein [Planctomycetota bacterium]
MLHPRTSASPSLVLATLLAALQLAPAPAAQVTTASLRIGGIDAVGCQGADDPPTLTGGVPASAELDLAYDQAALRLTLTVTNTSAVLPGQATPLLTRLFLNLPPGAITGATLAGQTAAGGATPDFALALGARRAGCMGSFELELHPRSGGLHGIANAAATWNGGGAGSAVVGPVVFAIDLSGPGAANVNARALAYGFSENGPLAPLNAGAKFQAGGASADESGWIGSDTRPDDCATSMWVLGDPRVGGQITFCRNGLRGCHDCLWISLLPGPTQIAEYLVPIGFPLVAVIDSDVFTGLPRCVTYDIPNDPALSGLRLYFVIVTFEQNPLDGITAFSFGDVFTLRIL